VLVLGHVFNFNVDVQSFDDTLSLLPRLLNRITKAALTTITFEFWVSQSFSLSIYSRSNVKEVTDTDATWVAIDELLAGSSFSVLTEVVFTVFDCPHGFEIAKYLERRLARCKERGLLRIFMACRPV
jgi:hypothetical protein